MIIYLIRCRVNGKEYVGQTMNSLDERWYGHRYSAKVGRNLAIDRAICRYGEENFEKVILAETNSLDKLNQLEEQYIQLNNTMAPNGYNVHTGGRNYKCSEETKRKIGEASKGRQTTLGFHFSEESKAKMSVAAKGRKLSEEHKRKIGEATKRTNMNEAVKRSRFEPMVIARKSRRWSTMKKELTT